MTAFLNKTPLIITAGQQTREMILCDPMLTNRDETMLPRPYVKWAYQPTRAQDVPGAIMRAYALALQPPSGPVYVSIPLDDWDQPALGPAVVRTVSARFAPDGDRLREFAKRISASKKLALVYGQEIERSGGWDAGVALAEKLNVPVFHAPNTERPSFPETHPLFQGMLPIAIGPLSERLRGFDLAVVIGAPVFRYYPYIAGPVLPLGCELLHITNDPSEAAGALVGDSLLGDAKLTLEALLELVEDGSSRAAPKPLNLPRTLPSPPNSPLTASEVYAALSELRPENAIVVRGPGVAVECDGFGAVVAHGQTCFILHLCQRRAWLECAGRRRHCFGAGKVGHRTTGRGRDWRRITAVFRAVPGLGGTAQTEGDLYRPLQWRIRHPEGVRFTREYAQCAWP